MAFQGEYFIERYGVEKALHTPPIQKILNAQVPVGMGTDGTRVSSYNPWLCLYWPTTGKTVGGKKIYDESNILSREKALELYTRGRAWFSNEIDQKGSFIENQLADFAVLSRNYFTIPDEDIKDLYSVMTVLGGKIVYAAEEFSSHNPSLPPISPHWSPIRHYGTYGASKALLSCHLQHHVQHDIMRYIYKDNPLHCFCWLY